MIIKNLKDVKNIASKLKAGAPFVYPTETVYGLGMVYTAKDKLKEIFDIKKRPLTKPLSINIGSLASAEKFLFPQDFVRYQKIAEKFLPGPLSVIFQTNYREKGAKYFTHSGKISLRFPNDALFLEILKEIGPVAGTSANLSGQLSITRENDLLKSLSKKVPFIFLNGKPRIGIESTILDLSDRPVIRRAGFISKEEIEECIGQTIGSIPENRHYKTNKKIYLYHNLHELDALVNKFKNYKFSVIGDNYGLIDQGSKIELTHQDFFSILRDLDELPNSIIFIEDPKNDKLLTLKLKEIVANDDKSLSEK